ncbi:arylamine N-acetyltransferase, pineal gland isozyme NAT-3-like [Diretmus argenteus]
MDVEEYLLRIGCAAPAEPTLDALRSLHVGHLLSVPFENLTGHSGGRVRLDLPLLYDKVVTRRRGGFCYENNSLFSWLLAELGFRVTLLSGQVRSSLTGRYGPPQDHLVSMVTLEEEEEGARWLCDVGFGAPGFTYPLSLETGGPQVQGHRVYRVREREGLWFLEWGGEGGGGGGGDGRGEGDGGDGRGEGDGGGEEDGGGDVEWTELYKFTLQPRRLGDFAEMCEYQQNSPSSLFFCKSLCSVLKPGGRVTYIGRKLITTTFPAEGSTALTTTTTRELKDEEIPGVLAETFGVVLSSPFTPKDEAITPSPVMY